MKLLKNAYMMVMFVNKLYLQSQRHKQSSESLTKAIHKKTISEYRMNKANAPKKIGTVLQRLKFH